MPVLRLPRAKAAAVHFKSLMTRKKEKQKIVLHTKKETREMKSDISPGNTIATESAFFHGNVILLGQQISHLNGYS